jgi:hypothetical protein
MSLKCGSCGNVHVTIGLRTYTNLADTTHPQSFCFPEAACSCTAEVKRQTGAAPLCNLIKSDKLAKVGAAAEDEVPLIPIPPHLIFGSKMTLRFLRLGNYPAI